jgi:hypothetical protein
VNDGFSSPVQGKQFPHGVLFRIIIAVQGTISLKNVSNPALPSLQVNCS